MPLQQGLRHRSDTALSLLFYVLRFTFYAFLSFYAFYVLRFYAFTVVLRPFRYAFTLLPLLRFYVYTVYTVSVFYSFYLNQLDVPCVAAGRNKYIKRCETVLLPHRVFISFFTYRTGVSFLLPAPVSLYVYRTGHGAVKARCGKKGRFWPFKTVKSGVRAVKAVHIPVYTPYTPPWVHPHMHPAGTSPYSAHQPCRGKRRSRHEIGLRFVMAALIS